MKYFTTVAFIAATSAMELSDTYYYSYKGDTRKYYEKCMKVAEDTKGKKTGLWYHWDNVNHKCKCWGDRKDESEGDAEGWILAEFVTEEGADLC